jgi:pimeloyl-ACP methyl ester carboxylesterase
VALISLIFLSSPSFPFVVVGRLTNNLFQAESPASVLRVSFAAMSPWRGLGGGFTYFDFSMGNWNIIAQLANVKARALILVGDQDAISFDSFQTWNKSLPNSVLINFKGAGHMPHVDYPAAFASAVETFMQHKSPDHEAMSPAGGG